MSFFDAIRTCLAKYVTFSGRASRPEYWFFALFLFLGSVILGIFDAVLFEQMPQIDEEQIIIEYQPQETPLSSAFALLTLLPALAAAWRRMHDTGRSGLYVFFPLLLSLAIGGIALVGFGMARMSPGAFGDFIFSATGAFMLPALVIMLFSPVLVLWWLTRPSQPGDNAYGPNPHEVTT